MQQTELGKLRTERLQVKEQKFSSFTGCQKGKKTAEKVLKIVKEYKSKSNKDLVFAMDFIRQGFHKKKEQHIWRIVLLRLLCYLQWNKEELC